MRRLLTTSALFALALALTATAQPASLPKGKADDKKAEKKSDPTDAAIAAALANDADVKVAQAKVLLAEAELAKARQAVTLKVVTLKAKIDQLKADVRSAEDRAGWSARMADKGTVPLAQVLADRDKLEAAKAALALAEAEWKLLTGTGPGTAMNPGLTSDPASAFAPEWLRSHLNATQPNATWLLAKVHDAAIERATVKGPVADRIRAAFDTPVKLAEKNQFVNFQAAREALLKAGIDIPFRQKVELETLTSEGETLPVGAWLQLFLDSSPGVVMVVREYGILIVKKEDAPPDAVGVIDFWKLKPPAKETKADPKK